MFGLAKFLIVKRSLNPFVKIIQFLLPFLSRRAFVAIVVPWLNKNFTQINSKNSFNWYFGLFMIHDVFLQKKISDANYRTLSKGTLRRELKYMLCDDIVNDWLFVCELILLCMFAWKFRFNKLNLLDIKVSKSSASIDVKDEHCFLGILSRIHVNFRYDFLLIK